MDEKNQQPGENSKLFLQLLDIGTGKVLWGQYLPSLSQWMDRDERGFWNDEKLHRLSKLLDDLGTPTLPDSSS